MLLQHWCLPPSFWQDFRHRCDFMTIVASFKCQEQPQDVPQPLPYNRHDDAGEFSSGPFVLLAFRSVPQTRLVKKMNRLLNMFPIATRAAVVYAEDWITNIWYLQQYTPFSTFHASPLSQSDIQATNSASF